MPTRKELIQGLRELGIDKVYGRSLGRCVKDELDSYMRTLKVEEEQGEKYYSWTQINTMLRCGLQYYYRYLRGIKIPPSAALTVGFCYDDALNFNYTTKIKTKQDEPLSVLTDVFHHSFEKRKEETEFEEEKPDDAENRGVSLIKTARTTPLPEQKVTLTESIMPVDVQRDIYVGFEDDPYLLLVILDLISQHNGEGAFGVRDNKTTKKSYNQGSVDEDLQLTAQSLAFRTEFGVEEAYLGFDVAVSTQTPKIQVIGTTRTVEQHTRLLRILANMVDAIRKRVFLPPPNGHWACTPKYCGYWDICHEEF